MLIIQGVIVLSVVIAYEVIRRANVRFEQRKVAQALAEQRIHDEGRGAGMSQLTTQTTPESPAGHAPRRALSSLVGWRRVLVLAAVGLVVVSLTRVITGANDMSSSGALIAALGPRRTHRASLVSAASGPSARAWSTSASRA